MLRAAATKIFRDARATFLKTLSLFQPKLFFVESAFLSSRALTAQSFGVS
jgi:hypothetical protein